MYVCFNNHVCVETKYVTISNDKLGIHKRIKITNRNLIVEFVKICYKKIA